MIGAKSIGGTANFAFGAMLIAFVVYVTAKGELGSYLQLFLYTPPAATPAASTDKVIPIPGTPGLNLSNPFAGLPGFSSNDTATPAPTTTGSTTAASPLGAFGAGLLAAATPAKPGATS
jgi:hypothetical protein